MSCTTKFRVMVTMEQANSIRPWGDPSVSQIANPSTLLEHPSLPFSGGRVLHEIIT